MSNAGKSKHYIICIYESIENNRNIRDSKGFKQKGKKINSITQLLPTIYQESQTHCRHEIRFQDRGFGRESRVPVGICGVIFTAFRVKSKSLGSPRRGMGSRRHLARRSVVHLWHFIKWRSWPATERKKDRSGGEVEKVEGNAARRKVDSLRGGPRNPAPSSVAVAPLRVRAGRGALVCVPARRGGHLTSVEAEMRSMRRGTHCNHCAWYARARFVPSANEKWDRSTRRVPWPHQPPRERRRYYATGRIARRLPSLRWLDVVRSGLLLRVLTYIVAWSRYSLRDRIIIWWFKVWC